MYKNSFTFGEVDMYKDYGLRIVKTPASLGSSLRPRKVTIPQKDGVYNYGAKYRDERIITFKCETTRILSSDEKRELACVLSKENKLTFWNETDKYYVGQIYDPTPIESIGGIGMSISLSFVCEPFAYGRTTNSIFVDNVLVPEYKGTAESPTKIEIINKGDTPIIGVQIMVKKRG